MMTDMQHRRVALIKRPPLVRSSSPATCYQSQSRKPKKSVRFCDSLESVRLFLKTDEPQACQSDPSSPVVYTYGLRLPNWPSSVDVNTPAVRMEGVSLVDKHTLNGTCTVANLAFEKHVSLHYSLDDWVTVQQVNAVYKEPIAHSAHTWDRFSFKIVLDACHETTTMYLAVKYAVAGRIFWDNNHGNNYTAKIIPKAQLNDEDSCCSSSDSDEEEEEEEEQMKHAISLPSIVKPLLSPPLSPTTPVDMNPLWSIRHPHQHHQHSVKPIHYIHSL